VLTLTSQATPRKNKGFTLLGLAAAIPNLATGKIVRGESGQFDDLISSHLEQANKLSRQVCLRGQEGSDLLYEDDGKELSNPAGTVNRALINGSETDGASYYICFYPDGLFDEFQLTSKDNKTVSAIPLTRQVTVK